MAHPNIRPTLFDDLLPYVLVHLAQLDQAAQDAFADALNHPGGVLAYTRYDGTTTELVVSWADTNGGHELFTIPAADVGIHMVDDQPIHLDP